MTYWLSRGGGSAEGPFAQTQIVSMWRNGQFTANDQLCEEGTEDWQPAHYVMQYVDAGPPAMATLPTLPPEPVTPKVATRVKHEENGCLCVLLALFGIIGLFFYIIPGLILFALAAVVRKVTWSCTACGNRIEKTSRVCPACGASLKGFS